MATQSYLILGAGVFGVSTALSLKRKYPSASVTLVDRDAFSADSRVAASWDWNKVVRADYDDIVYCGLAIEAQDIFKSDPLWKPYFHETGIYWVCRSDYATKVIQNYRDLGRKADLKKVGIEEAKELFGGLFRDADYEGAGEVLVNRTSGWAAAGDCLRAVTEECLRLGVRYEVRDVRSVAVDGQGRCYGLVTKEGETLKADKVVLSTGAFTPKLLEWSAAATGREELSSGTRILAGGITTGMTKLDGKTLETYKDMPVGMQGYAPHVSPFMGSLPPTPDGELKWWGKTIFTNEQEVLPGRTLSAPPAAQDYGQWDVSKKLKEDIAHANNLFYGKKTLNWKYEKYRICWDAFTTSGDFIISPHSGASGLYVATCGNFHGWKFFPVIGKYVTQMLDGELSPELVQKWAWDRERPDPKDNSEYPRAQMKNYLDPVREARL
ncbi:FAD dependent oxidoreductase-like protein 4 [Elsinoe fawcettii]|nr:FAD dependent oxidoreductase-like protein 4 [Elsinoe fawcettii]